MFRKKIPVFKLSTQWQLAVERQKTPKKPYDQNFFTLTVTLRKMPKMPSPSAEQKILRILDVFNIANFVSKSGKLKMPPKIKRKRAVPIYVPDHKALADSIDLSLPAFVLELSLAVEDIKKSVPLPPVNLPLECFEGFE
jgi:hypothetical protein